MKTTLCILAALAAVALVVGCGGSHPQPEVDAAAPPRIDLPERAPYRIGLGDKMEIKFTYNSGYNAFAVVRPDGMISVPGAGEVLAEGLTTAELASALMSRFAQIVAYPELTVMITEPSGLTVFVFGEVRMPGAQDLSGSMTLLDAIVTAGGVNYQGKKDSIILIRRSADGTCAGSKYDLGSIIDGNAENPYLSGRDVIYVPMSTIGKVDLFVEQFFARINPAWLSAIYGYEALHPEGGELIFSR